VELYINTTWTKLFGTYYIAEAIAWSPTGNHATVFATGGTAEEADEKLLGALCELNLMPIASMKLECLDSDIDSMRQPESEA
jgi:hypothetical protein